MFREPVFSLLNKAFIRNEDFIQSLTVVEIIVGGVYNQYSYLSLLTTISALTDLFTASLQ